MIKQLIALILSFFSATPAAASPQVATPQPQAAGAAEAMYLSTAEALDIVKNINAKYFSNWFDPYDVLAVIKIESSFKIKAYKYETKLGEASLGLMQILPSSARDRGFTGSESTLYDPRTNVLYGMKHLKWSYDYLKSSLGKAPEKSLWIKSYNAGVGGALKWGGDNAYWNKFAQARASWK